MSNQDPRSAPPDGPPAASPNPTPMDLLKTAMGGQTHVHFTVTDELLASGQVLYTFQFFVFQVQDRAVHKIIVTGLVSMLLGIETTDLSFFRIKSRATLPQTVTELEATWKKAQPDFPLGFMDFNRQGISGLAFIPNAGVFPPTPPPADFEVVKDTHE